MLASAPVRTAAERAGGAGLASCAAAFCALFFANGSDVSRLVWIGAIALVLAAALAGRRGVATGGAGAAFLGCLLGLAVWTGASTVWSLSPDRSWQATNRVLVYAAFAVAGMALAARPSTAVRVAAVLLAALYGWALLAKCVPNLYPDYERVARLRAPLGYWNELGLLGAVGVPVALWVRGRVGAVLLFAATLVTCLTYSRFGIALALLAAVAWTFLGDDRVRSLADLVVGGGAGLALFGVALALPGITADGEPDHVRWRDGLIFAALVLVAACAVAAASSWLERREVAEHGRRAIERWAARAGVAAAVVVVVLAGVFAQRLWHGFANPVTSQIGGGSVNVASLNSGNRWRWWQEEWQAFTDHPALGTGAGTFHLTDLRLRESSLVTTDEPHNTPLQMLGELGVPGFLLFLGAIAAAAAAIVRARRAAEPRERSAVTALGLALAVFAVHTVADMDWSFLASCGPACLVAGILLGCPRAAAPARATRRLLAAGAILVALGGIYSLSAPWLAQRALASAATISEVKTAHAYDPLSTAALLEWATLEDVNGDTLQAAQHFRDATALEPESSEAWFALGGFYYEHKDFARAYDALDKAWHFDRFGPAGIACGLLDQARHKVLGVWPPSCPRGSRPAGSP